MNNPVTRSIDALGLLPLARACGVSYQAVRKWERLGRFPRTEWTGETSYIGCVIAAAGALVPPVSLTREELLIVYPGDGREAPSHQKAA